MNYRQYHISELIAFRKTNEAFGGLSNMAPGFTLNINGIIIKSAEHLYQAMRFPLNPEIQAEILEEPSPMTAKMISRKYSDKCTRPDWEQVRFTVMRWVLQIKLSQNWDSFSSLLLSTDGKAIVEGTNKDKVWGAVKKGDIYEGVNALGRLLMQVREEYVKTQNQLHCVEPPDIPGFLLFNHAIEWVCNDSYDEDLEMSETQGFEFA
jgi:ribA/ribD-fused uncharacterized protein